MKVRDFVFPAEPEKLEIVFRRKVLQAAQPGRTAEDAGPLCRVVNGSGHFVGKDAAAQWEALRLAAEKDGAGFLCLPGERPFLAVAETLEQTGCAHPNAVGYTFTFVELQPREEMPVPEFVFAQAGETLWDIAFRYGRQIDSMVQANRHVPKIRSLRAGEKIYVARAKEASR